MKKSSDFNPLLNPLTSTMNLHYTHSKLLPLKTLKYIYQIYLYLVVYSSLQTINGTKTALIKVLNDLLLPADSGDCLISWDVLSF